MAAMAAAGVEVTAAAGKGRVLVARRGFRAGERVLADTAFVAASWDAERCAGCAGRHPATSCAQAAAALGPAVAAAAAAIEVTLAGIEGIDELDRARTVMLCLGKPPADLVAALEPLTAANPERNLAAAKAVRAHPAAQPLFQGRDVTDQDLARIIGVLNTNCHTLEELGGSGLFLLACICEHSCTPNCSYNSNGTGIFLTALADIAPGDSITLDYLNQFYDPTEERRENLLESYGFTCSCPKCTGAVPDRCRAFVCPNAASAAGDRLAHVVCAHGADDSAPGAFRCITPGCGFVADNATAEQYTNAEFAVADGGESDLLRPEHYINFFAIAERATMLSAQDDRALAKLAVEQWTTILAFLDQVLPALHHERVMHLDRLAQVQFKSGDLEASRSTFKQAFELAQVCTGPTNESRLTAKLKELVDNPPTTLQQLVQHYQDSAE